MRTRAPSQRNTSTIGLLGLLSILSVVPLSCGGEQPKAAPVLRPVRTQRVVLTGDATERTLAGVARSGVESRLSFRVAGTVDRVLVEVGDRVRQGQLLAQLDPIDYELRVQEAEAAVAQAQAGHRRAEADFERVRALYENNNAAKSELDAGRAAAESAQAQVDAGKKQLEQASQQVGYTRLQAPVAGAIAEVDVEVNENVKSGETLFMLTSGSRPEVEVAVPEGMIADIREGLPVTVTFDALPGESFAATVTEVGVAATRTATTFGITMLLDEPSADIRSGMAAEVTFRFRDRHLGRRVLVPAVAVGEDREGRFVFVLERQANDEGVVHRRPVVVGHLVGERLEILEGLSEGDELVTAGVRRLTEGFRVHLLQAQESGA